MDISIKASEYLINLIRGSIRDEQPSEKEEDVSWRDVLNLAAYHKVDELVYIAINKLNKKPPEEMLSKMEAQHQKNQVVDLLQGAEAEEIINSFTEAGIGILPLKGFVLKKIYPKSEMRQMGDLDFLLLPTDFDRTDSIMDHLGFEPDDVGSEDSHDVYKKSPYIEVELHRRLLPPTEENHWYTDEIWNRLMKKESNEFLMQMTLEDFYLYHLLHFEKHYSMGGSGIRSIIDQYVFRKKFGDKVNWEYVNSVLPKMNYVEFEKMCNDLAEAWFGDGELTEELAGPAEYIINSGAFGTFEQYQKWSFERYKREQGIKSKTGYFFRRMFMERERMEYIYPSLKKHRWLLPLLWIHRLCKTVFFRRDVMKAEIKGFMKKE